MTKKQLKKLAKEIAALENTIQSSTDKQVVYEAENRMTQLTNSADLELEDMLALDDMVQKYLNS